LLGLLSMVRPRPERAPAGPPTRATRPPASLSSRGPKGRVATERQQHCSTSTSMSRCPRSVPTKSSLGLWSGRPC